MEERLQKIIAASGFCSRRTAEEIIKAGRVEVNDAVASLGDKADAERDRITVDGRTIQKEHKQVYIMLNKPRGYVTSLNDEKDRKCVADLVEDCPVRVFPVGRLDMNSEGLLIFTNDGETAFRLMHPSHEVEKEYQVRVNGLGGNAAADALSDMTLLDGEPIKKAIVRVLDEKNDDVLLSIIIHEGKNRQIRRMCAQCGLTVKRLRRVREGNLHLNGLESGKWRYLTEYEIQSIKGCVSQ